MSTQEPSETTRDILCRLREQINGLLNAAIGELLPESVRHFFDTYDQSPIRAKEEAMIDAGKAVRAYIAGGTWPTNNHLEHAVWSTQLRGQIPRDDFRDVCDNLRRGWSSVGDC